jgi:hypothetical protein
VRARAGVRMRRAGRRGGSRAEARGRGSGTVQELASSGGSARVRAEAGAARWQALAHAARGSRSWVARFCGSGRAGSRRRSGSAQVRWRNAEQLGSGGAGRWATGRQRTGGDGSAWARAAAAEALVRAGAGARVTAAWRKREWLWQQARWIQAHGRLQPVASGSGVAWWRSTGGPWELRQDAQVARAHERSGTNAKQELRRRLRGWQLRPRR